jgi:hypothetical protein
MVTLQAFIFDPGGPIDAHLISICSSFKEEYNGYIVLVLCLFTYCIGDSVHGHSSPVFSFSLPSVLLVRAHYGRTMGAGKKIPAGVASGSD